MVAGSKIEHVTKKYALVELKYSLLNIPLYLPLEKNYIMRVPSS